MIDQELKAHVLETVRKCGQVSVFVVRAMLKHHQGILVDFAAIMDALEELEQDRLVVCDFDSGARVYRLA